MLAFLDYDGTLTTHECNEIVLQRFVGDAWRPLEAEAQADRMSHAESSTGRSGSSGRRARSCSAPSPPRPEPTPGLAAFLAELERPRRPPGHRQRRPARGDRRGLGREGLPPVELHASELVGGGPEGGPPYRLAFSDVLGDCPRCGPRACKGAALRALRRPGEPVLVFGDGASDVCPAREADLTFARGHLAERCAAEGLEWRPLHDFTTVWAEVDAWLAGAALRRSEGRPVARPSADPGPGAAGPAALAAVGFLGRRASRIMATAVRPRGRRCGAARPSLSRRPGGPWTHVCTGAASSS